MSPKKLNAQKNKKSETKLVINRKHSRNFSEDFKQQKVQEILEKRISIKDFCKLHNVSRTSVYRWIYKYSTLEKGTRQIVEMESEALKTKKLLEQVANLERVLGQKQLEIDYLQKILEVANEELGYDLKKKCAPAS